MAQIEKLWPWITAAFALLFWLHLGMPFPKSSENLFGTAATVASVFASFLGVAKAIILSIKETAVYRTLVRLNYSDRLFSFLRVGIFSSVFFAVMSILGFFISDKYLVYEISLFSLFSGAWIFSGVLALCAYIRITDIMFSILKNT